MKWPDRQTEKRVYDAYPLWYTLEGLMHQYMPTKGVDQANNCHTKEEAES
jgi:hypothetical protein